MLNRKIVLFVLQRNWNSRSVWSVDCDLQTYER